MTGRLKGKVALITGSSSGIGEETARLFAAEGAEVWVNSRASVEAGERIAKDVGGRYVQADVAQPAEAERLIDTVLAGGGKLDILVNNAGTTEVIPHRDLAAATPEIWMRIYATNVVAPFYLTTLAMDALRASGAGVVVNVGSLAGVRPTGSSIPYAASKAALHHQTRLVAKEVGPEVRVNAVAPGLVDTPWTETWDTIREAVSQRAPMRRSAVPSDVADVILSLATSPLVTGEVVTVAGGLDLVS